MEHFEPDCEYMIEIQVSYGRWRGFSPILHHKPTSLEMNQIFLDYPKNNFRIVRRKWEVVTDEES